MPRLDVVALGRRISQVICDHLWIDCLKQRPAQSATDEAYLRGRRDATGEITSRLDQIWDEIFPERKRQRLRLIAGGRAARDDKKTNARLQPGVGKRPLRATYEEPTE